MVRKMILRSLAVVVMVASTVVLPGCDEGKNDNDFVVATLYDVVELQEQTRGETSFLLYRPDGDEAFTLKTGREVFRESDEISPGD